MDHPARLKLFDAAWAEQGAFVKAVLWRLTGDRELFAEALQECLLQMWRHVEKLQAPAGRGYLYRIAQSAAGRAWRKRVGSSPDVPADSRSRGASPDEQAGRNELLAGIRRAISELPELQGRAVTMRYLEQKDYETIAREMDCPAVTTRSYVSRGLAALRNLPGLAAGNDRT